MTGYNTDTLTVTATGARNGYDYRCLITFADGTQKTAYTLEDFRLPRRRTNNAPSPIFSPELRL